MAESVSLAQQVADRAWTGSQQTTDLCFLFRFPPGPIGQGRREKFQQSYERGRRPRHPRRPRPVISRLADLVAEGSGGKLQFVSAGDLQAGWEQWCLRCAGESGRGRCRRWSWSAGPGDGRDRQGCAREAQTVECGGRRGASGQWWSVDFYYSYSRGRMVTHARAFFVH